MMPSKKSLVHASHDRKGVVSRKTTTPCCGARTHACRVGTHADARSRSPLTAWFGALPLAMLVFGGPAWAQSGDFVPVVAKSVSRSIDLPAEIAPLLSVSARKR